MDWREGPTCFKFGSVAPNVCNDKESVRIDKWLWAARMFKTRSLASAACTAGHVKLNGESVKASKSVRRGDHVEVLTSGGPKVLGVRELMEKRGPFEIAKTLYEDHTPEPEAGDREQMEARELALGRRDRGLGRPSKRDRRKLEKLVGCWVEE